MKSLALAAAAAVAAAAGSRVVLVEAEVVEITVVGRVVRGRVDVMGGALEGCAGSGRLKDFIGE